MKTAIIATALLTSLATTVMLRATDGASLKLAELWGSTSPQALDMGSTGGVPTVVYANRQASSDKSTRLWASAPGKGTRLMAVESDYANLSPFAGETYAASSQPKVLLAQAFPQPTASDAPSVPTVPAPAAQPAGPKVDETALRYFARQGDQKRLDAEVARLRALYPEWTPPTDPLAVPNVGDPQLDAMWQLYAQGKYAELRKAVSDRQTADPTWQVPADLTERLAVAESRERLINASDLKQYETVVRTATETPSLLTCGDVDVLWRLGEAFAETERAERARDAYKYVLDNCSDTAERVATVQKAVPLLSRPLIDQLMATERKDANGVGEFEPARLTLARQAVADAGNDPKLTVSRDDLGRMEAATEPNDGSASDAQLLGWYYIRREDPEQAQRWFTLSRDREDTAEASQGLALAEVELGKPGEAENVLYKWRDETVEIHNVYQAAVANYIATEPRIAIDPARLKRMAEETAKAQDPAAAQQFGWYARDLNQHPTAAQWFMTALSWKPDDEPSAYGLVLSRNVLGDVGGVREIQRQWGATSQRIANLGEDERDRQMRGAPMLAGMPDSSETTSAYTPASPQKGDVILPLARQPYQQQSMPQQPDYQRMQPANQQPAYQQQQPAYQQPAYQTQPASQPQPAYQQPPAYQPQAAYQQPTTAQQAPYQSYQQHPPAYQVQRSNEPTVDRYAPSEPVETARAAPLQQAYSTARTRSASAPVRSQPAPQQRTSQPRGCASTDNYSQASGQAALTRGWCLMELNRPLEAVSAFERAMATGSAEVQRDAAYGQSLAYLRRNLVDDAAVAASKAPQTAQRSHQLEIDILTQRASGYFEQKRYNEALLALDQRARITPERTDLMVLRGYAYVNLNRLGDAERVFKAVAASGNREGLKGIAVVNETRGRP